VKQFRLACAAAVIAAISVLLPLQTHAQSPSVVTIIVPYAAGGGTDTVARLVADSMSRTLKRPVVVQNVAGAGGTIANDRVARSAPDGSTILINHTGLLSAPSLFKDLRYDTKTGFEPIGLVNTAPLLLAGKKAIPGSGPKDFIAWMKTEGSKMAIAHGGIGTNTHLCGVLLGNLLGFKPRFVAYRGSGPAITDLLGGHVDLLCDQVPSALPHVRGGGLHGIFVTAAERLEQAKDLPTAVELGLTGMVYTFWHGLYVAKGTPKEIVTELNTALRAAVKDPAVHGKLKGLGTDTFPDDRMSPEAHAAMFAEDLERITKLIESAGVTASEAR
jgi:tripartite-type tricarboxylate transporter receptor subunit TctC